MAVAVIGSGIVFIESTVVNVALPAIGRDLSLGVSGLQWIVNGYLITLSALLLLGGALGNAFGQARST
jgi:MFS family permease